MNKFKDNIYCKQLSLHDLDRIRVGMCQPELDRLQINVVMGKRFASRFNELAEHCYRMYAGSGELHCIRLSRPSSLSMNCTSFYRRR